MLSFPPALPRCIKSCPPPYPVFPPRRFPEAQERVQHPDLNFNAILAPKASFCCCESSSGKCLCSSPAGSGSPLRLSFRQVQPSPACSPSCPSKGRKPLLWYLLLLFVFFFSCQLKGLEGKKWYFSLPARQSLQGPWCGCPGGEWNILGEQGLQFNPHCLRKPPYNSQLNASRNLMSSRERRGGNVQGAGR